ncbi:hypothetical protein [Rhodoplanes roseus]|uniref:Uncharacterized protein n=1 Tax=Rhodoplanes roseus TaxID=29409 RepID=A0A327KZI5_9BRAD|nr:hypothetical protein [Rhodoplanes roseus]RAI42632.1 hypothetical protein CH341_18565 [Rhodoplanes roseus]
MVERTETSVPEGVEIIAPGADGGTVVATAQLPNLTIEVVRGVPDGAGERISIHLQATPSFEAFGRVLEATNPFAMWAQAVQLAWAPFLSANPLLPFSGMTACGAGRPKGLKGPGGSEG